MFQRITPVTVKNLSVVVLASLLFGCGGGGGGGGGGDNGRD